MEQAASLVLREISDAARQANLLAILGVFAEAWITPARLEALLGRERLMSSDLLSHLMRERTSELERERADLERQLHEKLQQAVEDALVVRFPSAPVALVVTLRAITDPERLLLLHRRILEAPDQQRAEQAIREAARE